MPEREILSVNEINNELLQLWRKMPEGKAPQWAPMLHERPSTAGVVFVGLNPSFSDRGWRTVMKGSGIGHSIDRLHQLFRWPNERPDVPEFLELERHARKWHPYYAPHRAFACATKCSWQHLDVFSYRATSQSEMRQRALEEPATSIKFTLLGGRLWELFEALLQHAHPKAIVIINALAADIYLSQRKPRYDERTGHHWAEVAGRPVPLLLSSSLTGRRALDTYSRRKLFWHLKQVLHADTGSYRANV